MIRKRITVGERIGQLVVLRRDGNYTPTIPRYVVRCDCGSEFPLRSMEVRGRQSCKTCSERRGAKKRERHGDASHPLYHVYRGIKSRCRNPRYHRYPWYGGKGIDLCLEWEEWTVFRDWAFSHGWQRGLQIDRIDETKNYSPDNCQIVTRSENVRRMRATYSIVKKRAFPYDALLYGAF
jgi:hypothetical protein